MNNKHHASNTNVFYCFLAHQTNYAYKRHALKAYLSRTMGRMLYKRHPVCTVEVLLLD